MDQQAKTSMTDEPAPEDGVTYPLIDNWREVNAEQARHTPLTDEELTRILLGPEVADETIERIIADLRAAWTEVTRQTRRAHVAEAEVKRLRAELENVIQAERCQWLEANTLRIRNNELRAEVERLRAENEELRAYYRETMN